jgi:hypothetical protein
MPIPQLSWLDVWILRWLQAEAQRSKALLAASAQKLLDGFAYQEQQQIHARLAWLETKGLIVVGRAPGARPAYVSLTAAGAQCVTQVPGRLHG